MPTVAVNGTELHYERRGAGEPLLMVMGMGGGRRHWGEPFSDLIARDFDAISYDHRGIGDSGPLDGELSIGRLADDALGLLDALSLPSAHVLGISMGGMVAQELALRAPRRLRTLTLGCTWAGGPQGHFTPAEVAARIREAALSGDRRRAIRVGWEFNFSQEYRTEEDRFERFLEIAEALRVPVSVLAAQGRACAAHDTHARLGEIAAPTLVIHGTEDMILDVANAPLIAAQIPGARVELLEAVGHMFFWEQPAVVARLLREHAMPRAGAAAASG
jgi:pimeloyl-ACP methyl ester carboxylesterase